MCNALRWLPIGVALVAAPLPVLAADPLSITLEVPKRLELGKKGYRGRIKVVVQNRSSQPVTFHHGEENYLVFERGDGKLDGVCHSCACMLNSQDGEARRFAVTLAPGARKELVFNEWGCGGGPWPGPPAGGYLVSYRVFLERHRTPADPRRCCEALREPSFWKGALSSTPVKLAVVGKGPR